MSKALLKNPGYTIVERIVTNKRGELMRVIFAVAFFNGVPRARCIKAEKITALTGAITTRTETLLLSVHTVSADTEQTTTSTAFVSPYVLKSNYFFTSQMTRAPASYH